MNPSVYQQAIFDWIEHGSGNALVSAVAGSGKTSTLIEGAKRLRTTNACFVAFNRVIAEEIVTRLETIGSLMQASTIHSLGKRCLGHTRIDGSKYLKLCRHYVKAHPIATSTSATSLRMLVNFAQLTLTTPTEDGLRHLVLHYGLEEIEKIMLSDPALWAFLWQSVEVIIEEGKEQYQRERVIDFNDMIYLPTVLGLSTPQYDWLFIDECQDLNRAQLELVLSCQAPGGRLLFVGDAAQSLYGFAAADTESIATIIDRTQATVLPLSICYRCPASHVALAQQVHPGIEPSPTAQPGEIAIVSQSMFLLQAQPGDVVLGRCTAPLVNLCLKALQQGIRAKVRGRDIGAGILDIVERLQQAKGFQFATFLEHLEAYQQAQLSILAAKSDNELAIASFFDKVETVEALYQAYRNHAEMQHAEAALAGLQAYVSDFFSDEDGRQYLLFSTIHKAKGLEFDTVYVLPDKVPHPLAKKPWQREQELNAEYVLLTRAKKSLYFIGRLISNLHLPEDAPVPVVERAPEVAPALALGMDTQISPCPEAPAPVTLLTEGTDHSRANGGRPRTNKERLQVKLDPDVAAFLRSLKGGDDGYSGYLTALVRNDPQFVTYQERQQVPA
ncbi:MAG: ATP-dependent helicase [Chloroflexota bacterium]|nr:ATP-dependent helicase [Chloroflexota bacterium]